MRFKKILKILLATICIKISLIGCVSAVKLATICYLEKEGKTLFLHRNKKENDMHKNKWVGIGGKFEDGETPEECIIREFKEETELDITNPKMRGSIIFPRFFKEEDWVMFVFSCSDYEGTIIDSREGTLVWVDNNEIDSLEMWDGDQLFLKWMKEDSFFSAKIVYENQKLVSHQITRYKF